MIQKTVIISGRVQGVGFRYTTYNLAESFDIQGTVQNMPDGTVKIVAEGENDEIESFIDTLADTMQRYITEVCVDQRPATKQYKTFEIIY